MRVNEGLGDNICIWVWLVFVFVSSGALECMTVNVKNEANEKLVKTVMPCPMRRVRGTREEKQSLHLSTLIARFTKKQVDRKVKVFLLLLSNKGQAQQSQSGRGGRATTKSIDLGGQ